MIIVRLRGGLGNQMFQYALGLRLSLLRQDTLRIDVSWFSKQKKRQFKLDALQTNCILADGNEKPYKINRIFKKIFSKFFNKIHAKIPYYKKPLVKEQQKRFDAHIFEIPKNVILEGYWQDEKYFREIREELSAQFLPRKALSGKNQKWLTKIADTQSISLHIRRGDYVEEADTHAYHGVCSLDYYQRAIEMMTSKVSKPTFFIFSDDMPWARDNIQVNSPIYFIEGEGENQDVEEMHLMSQCRHHIIANSSYSWWGAWLGEHTESMIIAPRKWFKDEKSEIDIVPERWVQL